MNYFSIDTNISEIKEFNKGLTRVKINVAYDGLNRKDMIIPDNIIEEAFSTARGIPIVAHFLQDNKTIVGHEGDRGVINNRYTVSGKTYAYGFTDQNVMPYWEEIDGKKWICMIGYLFTDRFPEAKNIVDSFQSMEVRLAMADEKQDGHLLVDKMEFLALCSLNQDGKIPPTFENSKFVKFSEGEDTDEYYEKIKDLVDEDEFLKPSERVRYNKIKTFDNMLKWLDSVGITQISDDDKDEISEDYDFAIPEKYQHINFKPPVSVAKEAKQGLELREKQSDNNKCCTAVGLARARQLVNRQELSPNTVKRMKAYFDRHEVDKQGEGWGEDSKGFQAWKIWGGDSGYAWAKKVVSQMEKADEKFSFSDEKENVEVVTSKDEVIEGTVGEKDLGEIKRVAMDAKNCKSIIPKIFAKYPNKIDENITQSDLGYPLMSIKDGKFYYNTGFIKAASSRIEQNKEEPYYKEVRANITNARKHVGMPEEFNEEAENMAKETNFAMSMENQRAEFKSILQEQTSNDEWFYVRDFDEQYVFVSCDGGIFRYNYVKGEDDKISIDLNTKARVVEMVHYMVEGEEVKMSMEEEIKVEDEMTCEKYAEEIETLKATLKEKDAMLEEFQKEKAEFSDKLSELQLLKKQNVAKEILDHTDFSLLTKEEKSGLLSKVTGETDTDAFKMMAEAFSFQKVKNGQVDATKFSMSLPNQKAEKDEELSIYEQIKKEYNLK